MLKRRFIVTLFVLSLVPVSATMAEETKFDLVLRGGRVVDGTGAPWYVADVGVRDGKIAKIGQIDADEAQAAHPFTSFI